MVKNKKVIFKILKFILISPIIPIIIFVAMFFADKIVKDTPYYEFEFKDNNLEDLLSKEFKSNIKVLMDKYKPIIYSICILIWGTLIIQFVILK